jgi:hypothetical protein
LPTEKTIRKCGAKSATHNTVESGTRRIRRGIANTSVSTALIGKYTHVSTADELSQKSPFTAGKTVRVVVCDLYVENAKLCTAGNFQSMRQKLSVDTTRRGRREKVLSARSNPIGQNILSKIQNGATRKRITRTILPLNLWRI